MKKQTYSLLLLFLLTGFVTSAQLSIPVVPERVTMADVSVQLDPDARRIVQQDVNALMSNQQYWVAKLDRVVLYFPMIEAILIKEGVPTDFKYLAVQESSLTPDAVSTSTAVGYWQFKRETAVDNGLRVDDAIDERKSITASTRAAATYLKKNNAQFNNWVASLYSYYLGAGGISKLIPPDWTYAREIALDGRTDRYILRFFAHKVAIENALKSHQTNNRFALIDYQKGGGKTMRGIADELGIDEFELRKYNRWVLGEGIPTDKAYVMAIPVASNQINDVRQKIGAVPVGKSPELAQSDVGFPVLRRVTTTVVGRNDPVLYEINGLPGIQAQAGDNASSLARKAKISLSSFLRYNDMDDSDPVIVNDIYYLSKKRKKALVPFHTTRDGETSRSISQRYGLRLRKLLRFNRLDRGQQLATGRVMWLRERRPASKAIEIINAPTPPVYDTTPTPPAAPTRQDVAATVPPRGDVDNPSRPVAGSDGIPRNASERKRYQPKLVDGGITPNDGSSAPATAPAAPPATTVSTSRPAPGTSPGSSDGSQRVVIVRSADADGTTKTVPVATTPESMDKTKGRPAEDGWSAGGAKVSKDTDTYARNRPTKTPTASRPASSGYEGPSEQQADGTITSVGAKAPRPAAPEVVKTETRTTVTTVTTMPEKVEKKPAEPVMTMPAKKATESMTTLPEKKTVTVSTTTISTPSVTTASATDRSVTTHTVGKGETYYGIARQYGLTLNQLLELNNRTLDKKLEAGQRLKVKTNSEKVEQLVTKTEPTSAKVEKSTGKAVESSTSTKTTSTPVATSGETYHTVSKGENLFRISKIYNVSVAELQEWNNLSTAYVREGQKIRVAKP